ncbi:serine hydrolase domain-containing protein [Nocardia sp. NBC_00511]|uniref:serine hydrolase domain-containing protein n=1 Tax=Nocardia sp. NBC_00511 TaxID=2903591 RepID=UPI0030E510EE
MSGQRRNRVRAVLAGVSLVAVVAAQGCTRDVEASGSSRKDAYRGVTEALDHLVRAGFPGAQVTIDGPGGHHAFTAGAGDLATGAPIADDARVRIGSNTKPFVATVIMQLVAEGKVELEAPIERYLPGVVTGNGNDGNRISVHQLLQHTSGLPDYVASGNPALRPDPNSPQLHPDSEQARWRVYQPEELVRIAMSLPPQFEPGAKAVYTNTNYILLGMLIQHVTGHSPADEINSRILQPLGLRDTYYPATDETAIRGSHPRGYQEIDGSRVDFTDLNPSWGGAAGAMVATPADLNRFFTALLAGKLLPAAQLDAMKQTVPFDRMPGAGYGLALINLAVSCGKQVWGHGGSIPGFETRNGVTADGTAVVVTVNQLPGSEAAADAVSKAFDAAICA